MMSRLSAVALLALSTLAGCAGTTQGYPSLAPRPIEREVMRADVAPATAAVEPPPLPPSAEVAQIVASAQAADAAFRTALDKARPQIEAARGAAEGSEQWVAAQQAYSAADAARAPVGDALAELDRRRQAAVEAGKGDEATALAGAALEIQALDEAERALLAGLMPA